MNPTITDISELNNILSFTIEQTNVSYVNALRRIILAEIPTFVFRTKPHENNDAIFHINTSKFNNEILKQRLSCIPIHIDNLEIPYEDLLIEINVQNNSDSIIYVTTEDFKIKNIKIDKYLKDSEHLKIFPPDNISKQYIDFCRLNPKISDDIPGESLSISSKLSIGISKENGCFNVVSTCAYGNCIDESMRDHILQIKEQEYFEKFTNKNLASGDHTEEQRIKYEKIRDQEVAAAIKDWLLLDAKRITKPDCFNFKIETIGVFENMYLIKKAIKIIIDKLAIIIKIYSNQNNLINESKSTIPNSFDIILENEDYTIGKILEFTLYQIYYSEKESLTYCGFRKPHPHINQSLIRLGFKDPADKKIASVYIINAAIIGIQLYKKILSQFGDDYESESIKSITLLPIPELEKEPIEPDIEIETEKVKSVLPELKSITPPSLSQNISPALKEEITREITEQKTPTEGELPQSIKKSVKKTEQTSPRIIEIEEVENDDDEEGTQPP